MATALDRDPSAALAQYAGAPDGCGRGAAVRRLPPTGRRGHVAARVLSAAIAMSACSAGPREIPLANEPRAVVRTPAPPKARVALVLSSGGLRGLAHLGVLRVLQARGWYPDLVVGSSVGAVVGAVYAADTGSTRWLDQGLPSELDPWGSWLLPAARRRDTLEAFVAAAVDQRLIEDLPRRFVAVATERNTGCLVLFSGGDTARAVTASAALPGALAPVRIGGRSFADGGLGAPLPVRVARALGAESVIAVDTTFHAEPDVPGGLIDSVLHAGMVMSRHLAQPDRAAADVLLEPRLPPVSEVTLANRRAVVQAGERAALAQIDRLRRVFAAASPMRRPAVRFDDLPLCDPTAEQWAAPL